MESIIQNIKKCYVCATTFNLHSHHVFYGVANRKKSEKYGMKVWLCAEHHTGCQGVHFNKDFDIYLKQYAQGYFEKHIGSRDDFRRLFGKSYL